MAENIYNWQYNTIPGNANQGAVLMTRNDITQPPFNQTDFIWKAMEDVFGVSNVKLEYDEPNNKFHIYKTNGHLDNKGNWSYNWEEFGSWDALTDEVAETLRNLVFMEYIYDTSVPNALKVYGKKKDSTLVELCDITFADKEYVDLLVGQLETTLNNEITRSIEKDTELETNLQNEITRATNKEDELDAKIDANKPKAGTAIDIQDNNGKVISVKYDNDSIIVNNSGNLAADVFKDTEVSSTKGWSSAKISQEITSGVHYRGQVESYQFLPTTAQQGDMYNVADTGDNYVWSGTNWDKMSGDYIGGAGIDITGKVISATGIAFQVGDGLQISGTGSTTTLLTKNGNGLEYGPNRENKVKAGNAIKVDFNGVGVNTGDTTQTINNNIEVKPNKGLVNESTGLSINANFTTKSTPLGTENSKLALYSDGKIAVDFEESPVVLSGELLLSLKASTNTQTEFNNVSVPNMSDYDMIRFEVGVWETDNLKYRVIEGQYYQKSNDVVTIGVKGCGPSGGSALTTPQGIFFFAYYFLDTDFINETIGKITLWQYVGNTYPGSSNNWIKPTLDTNRRYEIRVYGMRAR